jgi:hypothetical protein
VVWTELIWLSIGASGFSCEQGNELSSSIKFWEVLESCATDGFSRRAELHGVSWLVTCSLFLISSYLVFIFHSLCKV